MSARTSSLNPAVHAALAAVVGIESGGIAWELVEAGHATRISIAVVVGALAALGAWTVSFAPEVQEDTELAESVKEQDMRGIPRWWGVVPILVAVLGAAWGLLALR